MANKPKRFIGLLYIHTYIRELRTLLYTRLFRTAAGQKPQRP